MNFTFPQTKAMSEYEKKEIDALLSNIKVKNFLVENNLDVSFLKKNLSDFQIWKEHMNRCHVCPGIIACPNAQKGYTKALYMDETGYLCDCMVPCEYKKIEDDKIKHRENLTNYSYMSKEDLLIDLWKFTLVNEYKEYLMVYDKVTNSIEDEKGIYLYGQPGVGKSYLMKGLVNHYAKKDRKVCFMHVPSLIQDIRNNFDDNQYQRDIMQEIQRSDILILDDIGSEAISEWQRDTIIYTILAYRDDNKKKTYFTSNYSLDELEMRSTNKDVKNGKVPANRVRNRIQSLCNEISLKGKSRR